MKKSRRMILGIVLLVCFLLCGCNSAPPVKTVTLENAIEDVAADLESVLGEGSELAVVFTSDSDRLSDFMVEELSTRLVGGRKLKVMDRNAENSAQLRAELVLQNSGEVSIDSMQQMGKKLGAQYIVAGSLANMENWYRVRFTAIHVETSQREAGKAYNVGVDDPNLSVLLKDLPRTAAGDEPKAAQENPLVWVWETSVQGVTIQLEFAADFTICGFVDYGGDRNELVGDYTWPRPAGINLFEGSDRKDQWLTARPDKEMYTLTNGDSVLTIPDFVELGTVRFTKKENGMLDLPAASAPKVQPKAPAARPQTSIDTLPRR